jgi:hypothetical protein
MQPHAAARLGVLARQLTSSGTTEPAITRADSSSAQQEESRPAPGGGRGTLTVLDNRTGKKYTVRAGKERWLRARSQPRMISLTTTDTSFRTPARDFGGRHSQRPGAQADQGWRRWRGPTHIRPRVSDQEGAAQCCVVPLHACMQIRWIPTTSFTPLLCLLSPSLLFPTPFCRYTNTSAVISRISYIDGDKGILRYRGFPIEELAAKSNFIEVAYLTLFGNLPTQVCAHHPTQLKPFSSSAPQGIPRIVPPAPPTLAAEPLPPPLLHSPFSSRNSPRLTRL